MNLIFLGDGITDAGRNTSNGSMASVGQGYVLILAAELGAARPGAYQFVNAGIAGSRVVDVYARVQTDAWNREPDVLSILVGINDVLADFQGSQPSGVDTERYAAVYQMLLEDTIKRFPQTRLVLMEPFVCRNASMEANWETIRAGVAQRAQAVKQLADKTGAAFVPLQAAFDAACEKTSVGCWLTDGVHPTPAGHRLIADAWKVFSRV